MPRRRWHELQWRIREGVPQLLRASELTVEHDAQASRVVRVLPHRGDQRADANLQGIATRHFVADPAQPSDVDHYQQRAESPEPQVHSAYPPMVVGSWDAGSRRL